MVKQMVPVPLKISQIISTLKCEIERAKPSKFKQLLTKNQSRVETKYYRLRLLF